MKKMHPIVGVWYVKAINAPFSYHLFTFHADGTMSQANPDAGDSVTSDSDGMGVWQAEGKTIKGKFVEITASRKTHQFVNKGEIRFIFTLDGESFTGEAETMFYDEKDILQKNPQRSVLEGKRISLL